MEKWKLTKMEEGWQLTKVTRMATYQSDEDGNLPKCKKIFELRDSSLPSQPSGLKLLSPPENIDWLCGVMCLPEPSLPTLDDLLGQ